MKTILITAYAVNPYKGSEDGTGWNITQEIAKKNKVILITRKNNIPFIKKYITEHKIIEHKNISYYGFDLPSPIMNFKKRLGERGYVLYYYFWQLFVIFFIKKNKLKFDIAHSLNFHSDSHPTFLWIFKKPTFWGPIGHHPKVPKEYILPIYGFKTYLKDRIYFIVKWLMRTIDPFFHLAKFKTEKIFAINSSVQSVLRVQDDKIIILPSVASKKIQTYKKNSKSFNVLSVGRFHYIKGFDIVIRSFSKFYHKLSSIDQKKVKLVLVGKGNNKKKLIKIAQEANIQNQITWIEWVDREKMDSIYKNSNVFLFPSHEGAGMVVPEAMSYGLPILCFDNVGPGELAGDAAIKIKYSNYNQTVTDFAQKLNLLFVNPALINTNSVRGKKRFDKIFNWKYKAKIILSAYNNLNKKAS